MKIELRRLDEIKPYDSNPRRNNQAVDAVAKSIREFGWRVPLVIDGDGTIICGHTRWKAATKLGLEQVPVHVAVDLTPEQIRAYRLADNQTASIATWDVELLSVELATLDAASYDLSLLGFSDDDLARYMSHDLQDGLCDPDDIPAPPDEAITRRGDLWVMGEHRLLCGDSGNYGDVAILLAPDADLCGRVTSARHVTHFRGPSDGEPLDVLPIHICNSDPPYNVKVEPRSNNAIAAGLSSFGSSNTKPMTHHQSFDVARQGRKTATHAKLRPKDRALLNDFVSDEAFDGMLHAWFGNIARVLQPGRAFYIWGGYANVANYPPALKACDLYFSQSIIWVKEHPVLTRKDFMGNHEWCFYGWREGAAHVYLGPNNATDVWSVKKVNPQSMVHLTEKPVELALRAIQYSSRPGEHVLDLFGGSGSTLIAAEQTQRRAFLMELDPLYCDVIVKRWETFTGRKAELRPNGQRQDWRSEDAEQGGVPV